jgi:hypothetical protein
MPCNDKTIPAVITLAAKNENLFLLENNSDSTTNKDYVPY